MIKLHFCGHQTDQSTFGFLKSHGSDSVEPLPNRWVAARLLRKAVRRGDEYQALRAATYLHDVDQQRVWPLIASVAWEEIGFGDWRLLLKLTTLSGSSAWRHRNGGEWVSLKYAIMMMCRSAKDRTIHDLPMAVDLGGYDELRVKLLGLPIQALEHLALDKPECPVIRFMASWYICGTERYGFRGLKPRAGDPDFYFRKIAPKLVGGYLTRVCRAASTRAPSVMPLSLPVLWEQYCRKVPRQIRNTQRLEFHWVGDLPAYAYDRFTPEGRNYIGRISRDYPPLRCFLGSVASGSRADSLALHLHEWLDMRHSNKSIVWGLGNGICSLACQASLRLGPEDSRMGLIAVEEAMRVLPMSEQDL